MAASSSNVVLSELRERVARLEGGSARRREYNVVVWVKVFERFRRVLLSSSMLGVRGRIQREGDVVHLVAHELTDLLAELASVGRQAAPFPLPHGRGDEAYHGGPGVDPRSLPGGFRPRNLVDPTLKVEPLQIKTRNFK